VNPNQHIVNVCDRPFRVRSRPFTAPLVGLLPSVHGRPSEVTSRACRIMPYYHRKRQVKCAEEDITYGRERLEVRHSL
jgi:hypothetical protein